MCIRDRADAIQNAAVPFVWIQGEEDRRIKVLSNLMVDMHHYLPEKMCIRDRLRAYAALTGKKLTNLYEYHFFEKI